jgi:hypothetical protein
MSSSKTLDDAEIRIQWIEALNKALGPAAALRFLTILHRDHTDYVKISMPNGVQSVLRREERGRRF